VVGQREARGREGIKREYVVAEKDTRGVGEEVVIRR